MMTSLFKTIFATDKVAHAGVCYALTMVVWAIFHNTEWAILIGAGVAFLIGLAKELYDVKRTGFDGADLCADLVGIMAACITYGISIIGV